MTSIVLMLLLAREASAQTAARQAARVPPEAAEVAAQATLDTSYLLAVYMTRLAAAGTAPSQADIDEATRQYFTNGAAVTTVPGSGPGAAYFQNGADVASMPSRGPGAAYFHNGAEVTAYHPAPQVALAADATADAGAGLVRSEPHEEDAGPKGAPAGTADAASTGTAASQPVPTSAVRVAESTAAGPTSSALEIQAAIAIASQFSTAAASAASVSLRATPTASPPETPRDKPAPTVPAEPAPNCSPGPSLASRIAAPLGGAFLGGLAVALWSRPRLLRVTKRS